MHVNQHSHLTYCTNVHAGVTWQETFDNCQRYLPEIRTRMTKHSFGIGLRLSNQAALELLEQQQLPVFKQWLADNQLYVFTLNGFPYGDFHQSSVKAQVHDPDWTTRERVDYTKRLFTILAELLPENMDGGVSTSPLSYRLWHMPEQAQQIKQLAAENLAEIAEFLATIAHKSGKLMHLDIEPEPDGILETSQEFISFYQDHLLNAGKRKLQSSSGCHASTAEQILYRHIQLCLDVCHFSVEYENMPKLVANILDAGISIGRIQISAAIKAKPDTLNRLQTVEELTAFDEPVYLHQTVLRNQADHLSRFPDLMPGLEAFANSDDQELRTHFHVPIFTERYGLIESTQDDIKTILSIWNNNPFTRYLEVETYTWQVLPKGLQLDIVSSITRELHWVLDQIEQ